MNIFVLRESNKHGPYTIEQCEAWLASGLLVQTDMAWHQGHAWRPLGDILRELGCNLPPPATAIGVIPIVQFGMQTQGQHEAATIRRISEYERISGCLWIIIGAIQCLTIFAIIAGVWNIFAGLSRIKIAPVIMQRDARIPKMFEGVAQLIIIALINIFLGGIIGIIFIIFDFVIRDMILRNRKLFTGGFKIKVQ